MSAALHELPRLAFRHPTEDDHARIVAVADHWFGRPVGPLLERLWFLHFASTSWIAETVGEGAPETASGPAEPDVTGRRSAATRSLAAFLVGFVSPDRPGEAVVHLAATSPALRRCGVGTAIHRTWLADMALRGARRATVVVPPDDRVAVLFYRSLGFEPERAGARPLWGVPAFADYDAEGVDRAVLRRPIEPAEPAD